MKVGGELRRLRKNSRLTLVEIGEKTGLSVSFLSDIERGRTKPSLDTLEKLAAVYQVNVNDILKGAETSTALVERAYPPGFEDFLAHVGDTLDDETQDLVLRVENRASRRAHTKEDWLQIYYSLKSILGR